MSLLLRTSPVLCVVASLSLGIAPASGQAPPRPQFRAGVTVVPVSVRVVDLAGNPVTDLSRSDFQLAEGGVPQDITQFSTRQYFGEVASPRTFVLLLGFGNHEPSNALRSLREFVQNQLQANDRVSVVAYLRASLPTTDHGAVADFLERYRTQYRRIEGKLQRDRTRVRGPMLPLSRDTLESIDAIFASSGSLQFQQLPDAAGGKALDFRDLLSIAKTLTFTQLLDGDKHLLWLLERRILLGYETRGVLARAAAGARTSVTVITTGGSESQSMSKGRVNAREYAGMWSASSDSQKSLDDKWLAEASGGLAAFYKNVGQELIRVARMTGFEYLLGYVPAIAPANGEYRDISVSVRRPGVMLHYAHGVLPRPTPNGFDVRRAFTEARLREAAQSDFEYKGIPLSLSLVGRGGGETDTGLQVEADPRNVMFIEEGGRHRATLELMLYVADSGGRLLAQRHEQIDLADESQEIENLKKQKVRRVFRLVLPAGASQVKAVVYDYNSDRLGSASIRLQ